MMTIVRSHKLALLPARSMGDVIPRIAIGAGLIAGLVLLYVLAGTPVVPLALAVVAGLAVWDTVQLSNASPRIAPVLAFGAVVVSGLFAGYLLLGQQPQYLLLLLAAVVAADSGAFFAGRTATAVLAARGMRPHRLSRYSPSKTWEGALGGVATSCVVTSAVAYWLAIPLPAIALLALAVAPVVAICGDLWESWLKRQAGIKDTSRLLGPHGGLLDRLDSMGPVLALCGGLVLLL